MPPAPARDERQSVHSRDTRDEELDPRHAGRARNHNQRAAAAESASAAGAAGERSAAASTSGAGQLFDPRRHDPVRFAMLKRAPAAAGSSDLRGPPSSTVASTSVSDARSMLSSQAPASSVTSRSTAPSVASSDASRERRRRRKDTGSTQGDDKSDARSRRDGQNGAASAGGGGGEATRTSTSCAGRIARSRTWRPSCRRSTSSPTPTALIRPPLRPCFSAARQIRAAVSTTKRG